MALTSGELLGIPAGVIGLMRLNFLPFIFFAGAGMGLKSLSIVATGT
jgi:hypothetical protein